jgi:para-nitrobenzyl esterase
VLLRDYFFQQPAREVARLASGFGVPVFQYRFNLSEPNHPRYVKDGDVHGAEVPFVFDNLGDRHPPTADELQLCEYITAYWTNLANFGSVNGPVAVPWWPAFNATNDLSLYLDMPVRAGSGLGQAASDFWDVRFAKYYFDT